MNMRIVLALVALLIGIISMGVGVVLVAGGDAVVPAVRPTPTPCPPGQAMRAYICVPR